MFEVIQHDIHTLSYRLRSEYRLSSDDRFYADPLKLNLHDAQEIYDLAPASSYRSRLMYAIMQCAKFR